MTKHLLTLAAAAALALNASAAYNLTLDALTGGWSSSYDADTKTLTFEGDWSGNGWGWWGDPADFSAYTHVEVEIEACTQPVKLVIAYYIGEDEDAVYGESDLCGLGDTMVSLKLDADYSGSVLQLYLQCGELTETPSVTIVSAQVVDNSGVAPASTETLWSGEEELDWSSSIKISSSKLDGIAAGDAIEFALTVVEGEDGGSIKAYWEGSDWSWNEIFFGEGQWVSESGVTTVTLTEEDVENLAAGQSLIIHGSGLILTEVTLVRAATEDDEDVALSGLANFMAVSEGDGYGCYLGWNAEVNRLQILEADEEAENQQIFIAEVAYGYTLYVVSEGMYLAGDSASGWTAVLVEEVEDELGVWDLEETEYGYVIKNLGTNGYLGADTYAAGNTYYTNKGLNNYPYFEIILIDNDEDEGEDPNEGETPDDDEEKEDGISTIQANASQAEYFNLQGMRVANPQPGQIVICRQGSTVTKVVM